VSPKHGGFSRLLTPYGSSGSWQIPLTNRDPKHPTKTFAPLFLHKYFYVFETKSCRFSPLVDAKLRCKDFKRENISSER
jgi:hypothetical protein